MADRLAGRRILITGAASGMGEDIARLFAEQGATLALIDRNGEGVAKTAANYQAQWHGACDVTDRAACADMAMAVGEALGGLDGVVNAAGILDITPFEVLAPESWDRMMAVNLSGPANIVRAVLPMLRAAPSAAIVNIASISGIMPMQGTSGYSASKAGLIMLTRCLGLELGPNIRVNAICPGSVKTEMTRYIWENEEHLALASSRVALQKMGEPDDISQAALFLMGEESRFMTGAWLPIDGGFSWR